jgi:hypothetical protein
MELRALDGLAAPLLARMQRLANRHRRDVLWNLNGSRVAENVLVTAALRCLPGHVTRHRAISSGSAPAGSHPGSSSSSAAAAAPGGSHAGGERPRAAGGGVAHALRQLRSACLHADTSVACRVPDGSNCAGCETGDVAPGTPVEHCCADSCPECNRTASRCVPRDVYFGDPLTHDSRRRESLEAYLAERDRNLPAPLKQWRAKVGRPDLAKQLAAERKQQQAAHPRGGAGAGMRARPGAKPKPGAISGVAVKPGAKGKAGKMQAKPKAGA